MFSLLRGLLYPKQCLLRVFNRTVVNEANLDLTPFRLHNLEQGPEETTTVTRDEALNMYKDMYRIRRLEQISAEMYKSKEIRGFLHLYAGEEAVATGIKAAMRADDSVITAYRCHSFAYLMGHQPREILSELMGRKTGCSQGKGGSMHMYAKHFYGGNGIVGAQVPVGAGIAFANKYRKQDNVCITIYGDGAANQGQVFEAYNMAKLWSLPVVFVCENNGYAMGTSTQRGAANTNYFTRCEYIPGVWVNGMDVLTVREAIRFALKYCSLGRGPLIFEMSTYRYYGHSMADPGTTYRTREEVAEMRKTRDPIILFKNLMIKVNLAEEAEITEINKVIKDEIDNAAKEARGHTFPDLSDLAADVQIQPLVQHARGIAPWDKVAHSFSGKIVNASTP